MISSCYKCGRTLKNPPWVDMHIGRVCAARLGIEPQKSVTEKHEDEDEFNGLSDPRKQSVGRGPFDIHLKRDPKGYATANVPHAIVRHSPTGFEWGYGGSGPAELALNILSAVIGRAAAEEQQIYQKFKWDVIAPMPVEGGTIKEEQIESWLADNGLSAKK